MIRGLAILSLFITVSATAQQYGNEWIDYSKQYYRFQVVQDGIYRIDYATMVAANPTFGTIASDDIQLFGKEKEVPIRVVDGGDGWNAGDYIEFYAQRNDDWLDSLVYENPTDVNNPSYSLYNDTLRYYLTWDIGGSNLRMTEHNNTNFGSFTPLSYYWVHSYLNSINTYQYGQKVQGSSSSRFTAGEGWFSQAKWSSGSGSSSYQDHSVPVTNVYTGAGAPNALIHGISASTNNADTTNTGQSFNHHMQLQYLSGTYITLQDTIFYGYQLNKLYGSVDPSTLSSPTTRIRHQLIDDLGVAIDYQAASHASIDYPHTPDLDGDSYKHIRTEYNLAETHSYYQFSNFGGTTPHIYILGDGGGHLVPTNNGTWDALIPNHSSGQDQQVVIVDSASVSFITALTPVTPTATFTDYASYALDSAYIILTNQLLINPATDYANYRSSAAGGSFQSMVVEMDEIYDQYGGGINKHALGIRRFLNHLYNAFPTHPSNVFIIGKGIVESTEDVNGSRKDPNKFAENLVPTWGYPPSDNYLTHFDTSVTSHSFDIPIGRLAAKDSAAVSSYLSKMIEYEAAQQNPVYTLEDKEWMKKVLHFSGGANSGEQYLFQSYLNTYAGIIEDTSYGGNAHLYAKTSSDPIDLVEFNEIQEHLEDGTSLITFFGHASPTGFDQNIDEPVNWNNQGKYPMLLGNSCYTGNIFAASGFSASEEFVLEPNRGTIGFMASSKLGFSSQLNTFATEMYTQIGQKNYGKSIGLCQKEATEHLDSTVIFYQPVSNELEFDITFGQMTLHGDPALRINPHTRPEYVINDAQVYFEPAEIDLTVDSITVNVIVKNIGMATNDQISVEITRHFPVDGSDTTYLVYLNGLGYVDTVKLKIPLIPALSMGLNTFDVAVDQPSQIPEEWDETNNNILSKNLTVNLDGLVPIYPYEYAIIPYDSVTLKASTVNPLAPERDYRFEVDIVDFDGAPSNFKRYQVVTSVGGVIEADPNNWKLSLDASPAPLTSLPDSTVLFWRCTRDSSVKIWQESSFQYITNKHGWGQAHFHQFKNNDYSVVQYNRPSGRFEFGNLFRTIQCQVYGNSNTGFEHSQTYWMIDNEIQDYNICGADPSIMVCVVDPFDLQAWTNNSDCNNPDFYFGDKACVPGTGTGGCRSRPEKYFIFRQNTFAYLEALDSMLTYHIPPGYHVLVYTAKYAQYDNWASIHPNLFSIFQSKGSAQIDSTLANGPFIAYWQQGLPSTYQEIHGAHLDDTLYFSDSIYAPNYLGNVHAEIAGPAYAWDALYWEQAPLESGNDSTRIMLHGIEPSGQKTTVLDTIFTARDSLLNLSTYLDASVHPFAQLQAFMIDSLSFTPAQLKRWQLIYEPVPEMAVNPSKGFYYNVLGDTVQEGQEVSFGMAIENVSDYDADSLLVHYYLEDAYHNKAYQTYPRQAPLLAGDVLFDTVTLNTESFPGTNSLWLEINPYTTPDAQDQLEQYYFNNLGRVTFTATEDDINPILDVTFDGIHILDGDLVSGNPMIVITLDDENPFLIMDEDADTSNFSVFLTDPLGNTTPVRFMQGTEEVMRWIPASGTDNVFQIEWDASFTMDGVYSLEIQGADLSDNESGDAKYDISFEVINEATITEVLNYPNPFTTRTQFVFTLTGSQVPDDMLIQIMTVTGKVVREITMAELGPIHIGRNRTEYWWDGRDMFGDPLARGVYLYRVSTKLNNEDLKVRETDASRFFKKGIGKMMKI